jgi:hypothetical protein
MEALPTQIINFFSGFKQNLVPLFQPPVYVEGAAVANTVE